MVGLLTRLATQLSIKEFTFPTVGRRKLEIISKVTSHHFFDCGGGILIGDLCCVGGRDAQFWTHFLTRIGKPRGGS